LDLPPGLGGTLAFIFGAVVGSFVNVVAWRMPREISIVSPRSYCESCERAIPWWANIPILAYLGLRGRCLMCGAVIPFRHFIAEVSLALIALFLYFHFPLPGAIARFVLCAALWICATVDYDWRLIPNLVAWPGTIVGFVAAALLMPDVGWKDSLLGILFGAGLLFATGYFYELVRGQEGVGMGDVWLLGMIGAFLGWRGVFFTLFIGSLLGAVGGIAYAIIGKNPPVPVADPAADPVEADVSLMQTAVPFGPFLAVAAGIFALFGSKILRWYFGA
ncbi:MAG TPA: prepilin peptidase, partial [Candidatus Binataceae bacterium]|nr:prepilin peptidase [Candidatus Binataceae bacterium]